MDQTETIGREGESSPRSHFLLWFLGIVATINVLFAIIERWRSFNAEQKLDALVLTLFLVAFPRMTILANRKKANWFTVVTAAYMVIILMTMLFTLR